MLFAADRTDYPAGIPVADGQVLLGVWAVWTQRSHLDATRIPFTSTSVRIRYGRARLGAGGRVRFAFTDGEAVGTRGPAVSTDRGATWSYAAERFDAKSFTYRFPQDAREVWFSMGIPYTQRHWDAFLARQAAKAGRFESGALCTTKKGRAVERLRVGRLDGGAKHRIFLTCRHHCCEMTASYVLEGALEAMLGDGELGAWYRAHAEVVAVPFVDKDGVEEGDQGKNRKLWDHCRDYNDDRAPIRRRSSSPARPAPKCGWME